MAKWRLQTGKSLRIERWKRSGFHAVRLRVEVNQSAPRRTSLRCAALRRVGVLGKETGACGAVGAGWGKTSVDNELQKHYAQLLGVSSPWEVKHVELKLRDKKVEIELVWQWGASAQCPECGRECSIHDTAPERTWRHLDTMQFTTLIRARHWRGNGTMLLGRAPFQASSPQRLAEGELINPRPEGARIVWVRGRSQELAGGCAHRRTSEDAKR